MTDKEASSSTNQFLTFSVADEEYGIDITKITEIKGWQETTKIPESPKFMKGVIDLRGTVVPIFDLRSKFGLGDTEINRSKVVIVVALGDKIIGLLVESVSDILTVKSSDIKSAPEESAQKDAFVRGLIPQNEKMIIILSVDKLFNPNVINEIQGGVL